MAPGDTVKPMTWQRTVIRDDRFKAADVAVVAALVTAAPGNGGDFYCSVPKLMELSRHAERSVRGSLSALRGHGYLTQVKRGGRHGSRAVASTWRLSLPNLQQGTGWERGQSPLGAIPNLHETASQPAPGAGLRERYLPRESTNSSPQVTPDARDARSDDGLGIQSLSELMGLVTK